METELNPGVFLLNFLGSKKQIYINIYTVVDVIIEKKGGKSVGKVIKIFCAYIKPRIIEKKTKTPSFLYIFSLPICIFSIWLFFPAGVGNVSNCLTSQGNVNYRNCMVTQKWCWKLWNQHILGISGILEKTCTWNLLECQISNSTLQDFGNYRNNRVGKLPTDLQHFFFL